MQIGFSYEEDLRAMPYSVTLRRGGEGGGAGCRDRRWELGVEERGVAGGAGTPAGN